MVCVQGFSEQAQGFQNKVVLGPRTDWEPCTIALRLNESFAQLVKHVDGIAVSRHFSSYELELRE